MNKVVPAAAAQSARVTPWYCNCGSWCWCRWPPASRSAGSIPTSARAWNRSATPSSRPSACSSRFNLDGTCLYLSTAAVFLAQATNTPLTIEQQIGLLAVLLLASKGAAGVAGAAFVVLAATLAAVGTIPVESVALILGVHRLMSQALTPTNLIGNGVATLVVAKWERALDERRLQEALGGSASASS